MNPLLKIGQDKTPQDLVTVVMAHSISSSKAYPIKSSYSWMMDKSAPVITVIFSTPLNFKEFL